MLPGSTSGLRPSCRLLQGATAFACGRSTAPVLLPHNKISSSSHHSQSTLQETNGPGGYEPSAVNSYQGSGAHLLPFRHGTPYLGRPVPSTIQASPAGKKADVNVFSAIQDGHVHGRVLPNHRPHAAPVHTKRKCPAQRRRTLLWVMLTAKSPGRAWSAYQELLSHQVVIPHHLLHQLVRHLASIKPRTRTVYVQLLSVLKTLQRNHGRVRLWEWNTLLDCAGKQWHKTRLEDYENSLDIFNKRGVLPVGNVANTDESPHSVAVSPLTQQDPDIRTYNILLSVAARSTSPPTVRHATSLLLASGLSPDRYTHLCLLRYFAIRKDLRSVRLTLRKMEQQGLEVGLDGINACLWAYARNGHIDVALRIYRALRSNVNPTPNLEGYDADDDSRHILETIGLDNLGGFKPDGITYTMMIQALAYHGDLRNALSVFVDMLSTPNHEANVRTNGPTVNPPRYKPSMAAFRGLFLGFARHGRGPEHCSVEADAFSALFPSLQAAWNQDTLDAIFAAFLRLPTLPGPTDRLVYWILVAFDKTSGNDRTKLREVWTKLTAKYGSNWGGRLEEIRRSIFTCEVNE